MTHHTTPLLRGVGAPGCGVRVRGAAGCAQVVEYTQERKQFGKALVEFQAVQLRLAEMEMKTKAARLLIHSAAARADNDALDRDDGVTGTLPSPFPRCAASDSAWRLRSVPDGVGVVAGEVLLEQLCGGGGGVRDDLHGGLRVLDRL